MKRRWARGCVVAVGLVAVLLIVLRVAGLPPDALSAAEQRWAERPFRNYRLVVAQDHNRCQHTADVYGDRVEVRSNPCGLPSRTVEQLFMLIKSGPVATYTCVKHGCACETIVRVRGRYSPTLGYPIAVGREWTVRVNWRHADFWRYLWHARAWPACHKATFITTLDVLSLTPLP